MARRIEREENRIPWMQFRSSDTLFGRRRSLRRRFLSTSEPFDVPIARFRANKNRI